MTKGPKNVGAYGTRLFIIKWLNVHGNLVKREDLVEAVMREREVGSRQAVTYHIDNMLKSGDMAEDGDYLHLTDPAVPDPFESWKMVGIPLSLSSLLISVLNQNMIFVLLSVVFVCYAFAVTTVELLTYYRLKVRNPIKIVLSKLRQKLA